MMQISWQFAKAIRDNVRNFPLAEEEVRRLDGKGEWYVTLSGTKVNDDYTEMFSVRIDNVPVVVYTRHTKTNAGSA